MLLGYSKRSLRRHADWSTNKARKANGMLCLLAHVIKGRFALSKRGSTLRMVLELD
jgi:hypothetical protein